MDQTVIIDVGGTNFKTYLGTLISVSGSYFSNQWFEGNWQSVLRQNGDVFIDRNAEVFPTILGYLRDGPRFPLSRDDDKLRLIEYEANYYKLPGLAKAARQTRLCKLAKCESCKPIVGKRPDRPVLRQPIAILSTYILDVKNAITIRHVVHIGWDDDGHRVVIDRSPNDHQSLKAIIEAIYTETTSQKQLYSIVNGGEVGNEASESLEMFFDGTTMRTANVRSGRQNCKGNYDNCNYEIAISSSNKNESKPKGCSTKLTKSPIVTDM